MSLTQSRRLSTKLISKQHEDKFPTTQLFLLALVRVAEPIALTSIFPYAWKLVIHFQVGDKSNASFYAGLLISAFALAESLTGMYWGGLSDRLGRKPVLIMGCLGTVASLLIVGFSANFWMALFGRLLGGALNGNIGIIQTMVSELVTNPEHEPKAYAIMPFIWSVGTTVGPSIGGYFAEPVNNFPGTFAVDGLFARFPYLLPNLICVGLMIISIVAGCLCLQETRGEMQEEDVPEDEEHCSSIPYSMPTQPTTNTAAANIAHDDYGTFADIEEQPEIQHWTVYPDGTTRNSSISSISTPKILTKRIVMVIVALGIFTYHSMTYDHLLPIFSLDERMPADGIMAMASTGPLAGGLGLTIQQVGVILSINGIIALVVQAIVFPIMTSWLGVWRVFILTAIGHPLAYLIVPWLTLLPENLLYPGIYACLTIRSIFSILAYPVLLILIKEASPGSSCLGKINGLAASTGAACRTIASPIAGLLYGIGINIGFTPLAWWASAFVAIVGTIQALCMRQHHEGRHHDVHPVAPSHYAAGGGVAKTRGVVRIQIQEADSGYSSADERTPLRVSTIDE